jgi:hypothetical protein
MATLKTYEARLPMLYQQRYDYAYWVTWANALLDRLSGSGMLSPQHLAVDVTVRDGVWIDKPDACRDVIRITDRAQEYEYRFVEANGAIRLLDARFTETSGDAGAEPPTLTMLFVAAYAPVTSLEDDLGLGLTHENLADAWFRWKVEEQVSSISQECAYWGGRVETEFARLRAEMFNRMNKPRGRFLAGFSG